MLNKFILNLLAQASKDPDIAKWVDDRIANLLPKLIAAVTALLPSFGGSILKSFMDRAPNLPNVDDLPGAMQDVAANMIQSLPDVDIPGVSDAVERVTGIDLSEDIKNILGGFLRR
jgi:hypothetical protein